MCDNSGYISEIQRLLGLLDDKADLISEMTVQIGLLKYDIERVKAERDALKARVANAVD